MFLRGDGGDEPWQDRDGGRGPKATVEAEDTEASFVPQTSTRGSEVDSDLEYSQNT